MRKNLTPEQIAKRDQRRAQFRTLWSQIAKMGETERLTLAAKVGIVTCEGRELSLPNQCLIALQNNTATVVGGFRQWIKMGRAVIKGQHGMMIWVPTGKRDKAESTPTEATAEAQETHFIIGTVFDIAQTQEIETGQSQPATETQELALVTA